MKKTTLLFCFLLSILGSTTSFAQAWKWGREGYGSLKTNDYASPVATDKDGNAYITGQYQSTMVFGNDTLNTPSENAYLTKYNSSGNVMWAKGISSDSIGISFGYSVATDKSGNVCITGNFSGNVYVGSFLLTTNLNINQGAVFIAKYNANGAVLWAKQNTATITEYGYTSATSITTDNNNNVFVTGIHEDTAIFGTDTLKPQLNNYPSPNAFLIKYDSNGNVLWAQSSISQVTYAYSYANSVITDKRGNAYITGYFEDTIQFGAIKLISNTGESGFIVKYSSTGNVLWAKQTTNASLNSSCAPDAITTDRGGYLYITGSFQDIVKFGTHVLYSPAVGSAFLAKYDTNGNAIWAKQSSAGWEGTGLAFDETNYIYMAGISYYGNADSLRFDHYAIPSNPWAYSASFIMMFDTVGHPICGSILNNLGDNYTLNGVAADPTGNYVYTAGTFSDTVVCGWDVLLDQGGGDNTFVGRWLNCNSAELNVAEIPTQNADVVLYPNPTNGKFSVVYHFNQTVGSSSTLEVYNMLGEKVFNQTLTSQGSVNEINIAGQPDGIYLVRILSQDGSISLEKKIIKTR